MSYAATMGTSSCATIAVGGFKAGQMELNEAYKANKKSFVCPKDGYSVDEFSSNIIYPTSQPLGRTFDMPFEKLMEDLADSALSSKFVIATINKSQWLAKDNYWGKELRRWGFKLTFKCNNSIGMMNYIYTRNPNGVEIGEGEE